mgnify:CR=1 FL=1
MAASKELSVTSGEVVGGRTLRATLNRLDEERAGRVAEAMAVVDQVQAGLWATVTRPYGNDAEELSLFAEAVLLLQMCTTHGPVVLVHQVEEVAMKWRSSRDDNPESAIHSDTVGATCNSSQPTSHVSQITTQYRNMLRMLSVRT